VRDLTERAGWLVDASPLVGRRWARSVPAHCPSPADDARNHGPCAI